jgi:hypothetical protein
MPNKTKSKPVTGSGDNFAAWLSAPASEKFFGRGFVIKLAVLVHLMTGNGSLAEIAKKNGVSRQAVHEHAVKAREIYFGTSRLT